MGKGWPVTADELLAINEPGLNLFWQGVVNSRNEPGALATWVKAIWLDGYMSGQQSRE